MTNIHDMLVKRFTMEPNSISPYIGTVGGRNELVNVFAELGYNNGVEVGTHDGHFAERMRMANSNLKLTCVDPYIEYWEIPKTNQERHYRRALERLNPLGIDVMRLKSIDAVNKFEDRSLDFVYIDGDHQFDSVMVDIILWSKKVRVGGMLSGHDYFYLPDVSRAVQTYVDCHNIHPWYALREVYSRHRIMTGSYFWVVT